MAEEKQSADASAKPPLGLLAWIAAYKLSKSAAMLTLAIGSLRVRHTDLLPLLQRWVTYLELDPHGAIVATIAERLTHLTSARFQWVRGALFFYFVLSAVEGIGLATEQAWAEWLTILATALLLPPAIYEMMHHPLLSRFIFVQFNIGMIAYLLRRIRNDAAWEMGRRNRG